MQFFDPLSPATLRNPYPVYSQLRANDPVHWHERLHGWVVSRHTDCAQILQDHETFRSDFRIIGEEAPEEFLSLQTLDLPDHAVVRRAILSSMREVDLAGWLQETRRHAEKLLAELGRESFDLITQFVEPLAAHSMCLLFGIPLLDDEESFRSAQRDLVLSMDSGLDSSRRDAGMRARRYLSGLVEPWIERPPSTGLLANVDFASVRPRLNFLVNSLRAIFVAGYSSSSSGLGNAVRVLAENHLLSGDASPRIDQTAFHELMRFEGPVQAESRALSADATVGDRRLPAGSVVVVLVGAANRDETVFSDGDRLRLDRTPNPHLAFGRGIHACVGTRLALMLGVEILGLLTARYRIRLDGEAVQRPTATLRGLDRLPVHLEER